MGSGMSAPIGTTGAATRCSTCSARAPRDLGGAGLGDPQPAHAEQRDQRVRGRAVLPRGGEDGGELQRMQHVAVLALPGHVRPGHGQSGVAGDELVDHGVPEQPGDRGQAAADRRGGVAGLLEVAQVQLQVRPLGRQRGELVVGAPLPEAAQVLPVGAGGPLPVPGEEAGSGEVRGVEQSGGQVLGHDRSLRRRTPKRPPRRALLARRRLTRAAERALLDGRQPWPARCAACAKRG